MTPEIIIPIYENQVSAIISCVLDDGTLIDHHIDINSYIRLVRMTAASERHRVRAKNAKAKAPKKPAAPKPMRPQVAIVRLTKFEDEVNPSPDNTELDSDSDEDTKGLPVRSISPFSASPSRKVIRTPTGTDTPNEIPLVKIPGGNGKPPTYIPQTKTRPRF